MYDQTHSLVRGPHGYLERFAHFWEKRRSAIYFHTCSLILHATDTHPHMHWGHTYAHKVNNLLCLILFSHRTSLKELTGFLLCTTFIIIVSLCMVAKQIFVILIDWY